MPYRIGQPQGIARYDMALIPEVSEIEILTYLMEEHDLKSSDLY